MLPYLLMRSMRASLRIMRHGLTGLAALILLVLMLYVAYAWGRADCTPAMSGNLGLGDGIEGQA